MMPAQTRRKFLQDSAMIAAGALIMPAVGLAVGNDPLSDTVNTVRGPIPASTLGFTLSHEHVMVDFVGAAEVSPSRYEQPEVFRKVLPYLLAVKEAGCKTFADCTPAWIGRDVDLLKKLSLKTGLNIITNTGYYGAGKEKYIPPHAYTETAEQLANRWINEFNDGIDGTGIKPGFIKSGVDSVPLSRLQQKLVKAAAITHRATGLTIFIHTTGGEAALAEMEILRENGVDPSAWNWVHAQTEKERRFHINVAKAGGWVSFDSFNKKESDYYLRFLKDMRSEGLLHRVLLSHDAGWYQVGEKDGGEYRGHTAIQEYLVPALRKENFLESEIRQIFHQNPASAFAIRRRLLKTNT